MATKIRKSNIEDTMTPVQKVMKRLDLSKGMSINRAIIRTRDYLDNQSNPTKAANAILHTLEVPVPYIEQPSKANVFALASVEQVLMQDIFDPISTSKIIELKFNSIRSKMPFCFKDGESTEEVVSQGKKGAKRAVANQIYSENKHKDDKEVIALIAEALEVSSQNAYTYLYLIKKSLKV